MRQTGVIIAAVAVLIASCASPSALDSSDAGRTRAYEPGVPNFDMETVVRSRDGATTVETHLSIPYSSLVFVRAGEMFEAEYEVLVEVAERESKDLILDRSELEIIQVASYDSTIMPSPHVRMIPLEVPPGSYVFEVTLTDQKTDTDAVRRQAVSVPSLQSDEPYVSRIHLEAQRDGGGFEPLVSLHVPAMMDSLRALIQVLNLSRQEDLTLAMRLVKFESDTSIAPPPYWLIPTRASLASRGVFYDEVDTIQVSQRTIASSAEDPIVEFSLPRLSPGIYHLEITGMISDGDAVVKRDRMLSVKNESYPRIADLHEMIEALTYIAFDDEIEFMQEAETPEEAKGRFDAFWGSRVPNRNLAASLIRLYYGRVEEATLYFTGYKEGWKTDRGMVYVVMGPPLYVDQRVESETWHYSYGDRDPANTFIFEKVQYYVDQPFENYILQRRPYYQREWTRAVDLWRRGDVL